MKKVNKLNKFIVAGYKSWNKKVFDDVISHYPGSWYYIDSPDVIVRTVKDINPLYIFFLHWSWIVPKEIIKNYECVCFHMADVPYGRGGSPLQNLIIRGHSETKLTALRMVEELDAGPVYFRKELSLHGSTAEEILIRATYLSAEMIKSIIQNEIIPQPQDGEVVQFKRRQSQESEIPELHSLESLYDFIRMLDAEGYPKAFIVYKGFKFELSRASYYDKKLLADVKITKLENQK